MRSALARPVARSAPLMRGLKLASPREDVTPYAVPSRGLPR